MLLKILPVLLLLNAAVNGQRELSLQVIETMKSLQPLYKDLQEHVVTQLTDAKLKGSDAIYLLHGDIVDTKERFLLETIHEESQLMEIIEAQPESVNPSCLGFVRTGSDLNVNLAGVSYTNCINEVDDSFNGTLYQFYGSLQGGESSLAVANMFDFFEDENIFYDPQSLIDRMNERMEELSKGLTEIDDELSEHVDGFKEELDALKERYEQCLEEGMTLLHSALELARTQIVQICRGQLEPASEEETTNSFA